MQKVIFAGLALSLGMLAIASSAQAAVQFNQNVTNNAIWGAGNSNGGYTTDRNVAAGIELGLRAHIRFPVPSDNAAGIMSQGNGDYGNFAAQGYGAGNTRASWNFDWSINSSFNGSGGNLGGLTYLLEIDFDPTGGTNFLSFDPINNPSAYTNGAFTFADHSFGNNGTAAGAGVEAIDLATYNGLVAGNNLGQNSAQLNFFNGPQSFNPFADGIYEIRLSAYGERGLLLAQSEITVLVGNVPEAASLAVWCGLGACGIVVGYWRKKRAVQG